MVAGSAVRYAVVGHFSRYSAYMFLHLDRVGVVLNRRWGLGSGEGVVVPDVLYGCFQVLQWLIAERAGLG